ncbi:unnamed protein product (macronuclear) [Paramecium tetraurelia]|uniref:Ubiquitin carboxyl-terminal hydrolase n=1 Tax=Paramecium tetraurelia TaxID=5888 RepID=A0EG52_PARTE|nr:uncharacterized protein GSPATT00026616001 [Paramecium tetraurelia]CAK94293.1 unnamed protein product [Paramecium tetraurelia]|eukprot:XP_001461666.1 hypothetical protein (macronuclear) [Paramecium tetraurelia strain d4-2]
MNTEQRFQPKLSRILDVNYKQIPNKFRKQATQRRIQQNNQFETESQGLLGLTNLGNTCFLNSSIQALSNTQPLTDYFMSQLHVKEINPDNPLSSQGNIVQSFAQLIRLLWQKVDQYTLEEIQALKPTQFISTIGNYNPIFAEGTQEDAHEFIAFLLDMIHEDLNRIKKKPYVEQTKFTKLPTNDDAHQEWTKYLSRNQSIIVDLFQGHMLDTLSCLTCKSSRYCFEPFMYLSVPVLSRECDLLECIEEFLKTETLTGDEGWNCTKCSQRRDSNKKIDLWSMPNILIIHLKRFKFNSQFRAKIRSLVRYPLQNLSFENLVCTKQIEKPTYDLYAVINHSGTLTSGHYTAYAKNRDDLQWYHYNDSLVSPVSQPENQSDAYLLFYFKNSVEEFKRQTLEGVNVSQQRRSIINTIVVKQTMLNVHSQQSNSNISENKRNNNNFFVPSISSQAQKRMLFRRQTKHFQIVKAQDQPSFQQDSIIIQEEN